MSDLELSEKVYQALGRKWDEYYCRICGWPLMKNACTKNSCSMRPAPKHRADAFPDYPNNDYLALYALKEFCRKNSFIWKCGNNPGEGFYFVAIRDRNNIRRLFQQTGSSLARAICFAIIEAAEALE